MKKKSAKKKAAVQLCTTPVQYPLEFYYRSFIGVDTDPIDPGELYGDYLVTLVKSITVGSLPLQVSFELYVRCAYDDQGPAGTICGLYPVLTVDERNSLAADYGLAAISVGKQAGPPGTLQVPTKPPSQS